MIDAILMFVASCRSLGVMYYTMYIYRWCDAEGSLKGGREGCKVQRRLIITRYATQRPGGKYPMTSSLGEQPRAIYISSKRSQKFSKTDKSVDSLPFVIFFKCHPR